MCLTIRHVVPVLLIHTFFLGESISGVALTLKEAIELAFQNNPSLASEDLKTKALRSGVSAAYAVDPIKVGISELQRGQSTTYLTFAQKIDFPSKYFLRARRQNAAVEIQDQTREQEKQNLRAEVISTYYSLYSIAKIIQLTERDRQRLKELSRTAESKYAAGKAPQHDSMRAHVAQTQIEVNLITLKEEKEVFNAKMAQLLGERSTFELISPNALSIPDVRKTLNQLNLEKAPPSPKIAVQQQRLRFAQAETALAGWDFAPDFHFRYQARIAGAPSDSHILGVELSIPLWFWGPSAKLSSSRKKEQADEKRLTKLRQEVVAALRILRARILAEYEMYLIFETSLIPQALTSFNSAAAAYRANKISFLDYLDTERALLKVEIGRFRTLARYMDHLSRFEAKFGQVLFNPQNSFKVE